MRKRVPGASRLFAAGLILMLATIEVSAAGKCRKSFGRGAAPTEQLARLQAWEQVAQVTGNWPVVTYTFRNESFACAPVAGGWRCRSSILVCRGR